MKRDQPVSDLMLLQGNTWRSYKEIYMQVLVW